MFKFEGTDISFVFDNTKPLGYCCASDRFSTNGEYLKIKSTVPLN